MDSSTSPLCSPREEKFHSPPESPSERKPEKSSPKALIPVDRYGCAPSPHRSPREEKKPVPIPEEKQNNVPVKPPSPVKHPSSVKPPSPILVMNRSIREELSGVTKVDRGGGEGFAVAGGLEDGGDRRSRATLSIPRRTRREAMVKRAALGLRVCEVVFCLISFSVMAADKTQGWSGDSFDRYKEYRYCISVTIIGFVYGGFQAYDLAYHLITGKHLIRHHLRYYFDFSLDQILAYLLISASSSAATRVDDWQSNWGKDPFTEMASASIGMSFLAFFAFAVSSLISGYNLCSRNWT